MPKTVILPIAYLPNISYFRLLLSPENQVLIEAHESFVKQSCRTRAVIASANGLLPLNIPILKTSRHNTPIHQVEISYHQDWITQHLRSIKSAYGKAPFFIHYIDLVELALRERPSSLFQLNIGIIKKIAKALRLDLSFSLSSEYINSYPEDADFRNEIPAIEHKSYSQQFSHHYPFSPNLSILDPLFNLGPETVSLLLDK